MGIARFKLNDIRISANTTKGGLAEKKECVKII
jgi:hypothetical protein